MNSIINSDYTRSDMFHADIVSLNNKWTKLPKHGKVLTHLFQSFIAILLLTLMAMPSMAQTWPSKPIRLIVPFAAGGGTDLLARLVAQQLTITLGQSVQVENRTGASGVIGTDATAKAIPDGYTIMIATPTLTVNPSLIAKLPYDTIKDFAPITLMATAPHLLAVHPSLPVKTIAELVALARTRSEPLTFSSGSSGGSSHLAGEFFNSEAGVKMLHIPYRGTGEAVTSLISGVVSLAFLDVQTMLPHVKSGRVRAIAVTGSKRSTVLPELPTIAESAFPGFESGVWYGVLAPARTPPEVVARLNAELVKIVQSPEVRKLLQEQGAEPVGSSAQEFGNLIRTDIARWNKVIKAAGITTN